MPTNSELSGRERMLRGLKGESVDRLPVFCANQSATYDQMENLGSYWPEAHRVARDMANLAAGAYTLLGFDAVRVPFCQTVEAEALGCGIKDGGKKNLPSVSSHPYKVDDTPEYPADFLIRGRVPVVIEAIKLLKEEIGDKVMVIGGICGPFSIATSLLGPNEILKNSFRKPHLVEPFMELSEKAGTALGRALIEAGADAICIEDMMASQDMISPGIYRDVVTRWEQKQFQSLSSVPLIIHICGNLDRVIGDIAQMTVNGISVEPKINVALAKEQLGKSPHFKALIGGVEAVDALYSGSPEEIKLEVARAVANGYDMIAPGCAVPPATTIENLRAMLEGVTSMR